MDLVDRIGGSSSLIRAAARICDEILKLLEQGTDPISQDRHGGSTAILRATDNNCISALDILLENQESHMCLDDDDQTLLHGASAHGWLDVVLFLNKKALDSGARDSNGLITLYEASKKGYVAVVDVFLGLGADLIIVDNFGRTPRLVGWQHGKVDIMQSLQRHDAANNINPISRLNEAKRPMVHCWARPLGTDGASNFDEEKLVVGDESRQ